MATQLITETSATGRAALRHHEGDVLRAYLCPANKWTIGVGLTRASGVVDPKPGMTITAEESDRLLRLALARNYEPRVMLHFRASTVPHAQTAFDGAVSFDFNTGRIHNASWVRLFGEGDFAAARRSLMQWVRGGGRVLPGLERRRRDEAGMIFDGRYPAIPGAARPSVQRLYAPFVVDAGPETRAAARAALAGLGYAVGDAPDQIAVAAVEAFQRDHALTVDGLIGRATLSTLQREIDARGKSKTAAGTTAAGGATATGAETAPDAVAQTGADPALVSGGGLALAALGVVALAWLAWRYRDVIAVPIQHRLPRVAAWLRSF